MGNVNSHIQVPNAILKQFRDEEDPEKKVWYLDLARRGQAKRDRQIGNGKRVLFRGH